MDTRCTEEPEPRGSVYLLSIVVALIVHGSLYPWHFVFVGGASNPFAELLQSWPALWDYDAFQDAALNVALYCPLGLTAYWAARKRGVAFAAAFTLGLGLALSTALELLQVHLPPRIGSACDVLFNCIGTALGIALSRGIHVPVVIWPKTLRRFSSPPALLLALWVSYQLYPFVPQFRTGSLPAEFMFLLNPRILDARSPYPLEILTATAEWLAAGLAALSLSGRARPYWIAAAVCFRILVRPFLLTRLFALDDLIGSMFAIVLWILLRRKVGPAAGLALLAIAILLRQVVPLDFSRLPYNYSAFGELFRSAFDCGAMVWLFTAAGMRPLPGAITLAGALTLLAAAHRFTSGPGAPLPDPVIACVMALALWVVRRAGGAQRGCARASCAEPPAAHRAATCPLQSAQDR